MFRSALRLQLLILVVGASLVLPAVTHASPTFLSAINISDPGKDGFEPQVVVAPDGTVIAVWTRSDGTNFRIQSSSRSATGNWATPQTVSDPGVSASGPSVGVDPSGNAVLAWTQSDGTNLRIYAAYRPSGGTFGAPGPVSTSGQDASAPDVSMDNSGNALVGWQRTDGVNLRVQTAIRTPGVGGVFGTPVTLSLAGQDAFEPKVAAGPSVDANGVAVWTRSDGTNLRVQSARRKDVVGFPRPKGASPLRVSLVPAFNACTSANRVHGAALAFPSCAPPAQSSSVLTIGSPDANGSPTPANFNGSVRFSTVVGNSSTEADEADVKIVVSLTDVRNRPSLTDYVGNLTVQADVQITDNGNSAETPEPGTVQSFKYSAPFGCVSTVSTTIGSTCNLNTTADAIVPGTVVEGSRSVWAFGQIEIKDAGPDTIAGNGDDSTYLRQGVFVP
jgi:hypothetical protein